MMKVEINDQGELCIEGESMLEFYALNCWYEAHASNPLVDNQQANGKDGSSLVINTCTYTQPED